MIDKVIPMLYIYCNVRLFQNFSLEDKLYLSNEDSNL
jgi:hypothetical protein